MQKKAGLRSPGETRDGFLEEAATTLRLDGRVGVSQSGQPARGGNSPGGVWSAEKAWCILGTLVAGPASLSLPIAWLFSKEGGMISSYQVRLPEPTPA